MSPVVTAVIVGILTTLGKWAKDKPIDIQTVVGVMFLALMLAGIEQANEKLARILGALVVVGVLIAHAEIILDKTGLGKLAK